MHLRSIKSCLLFLWIIYHESAVVQSALNEESTTVYESSHAVAAKYFCNDFSSSVDGKMTYAEAKTY